MTLPTPSATTQPPRPSSRYIGALDGLRALAIATVIFHGVSPHSGQGGLAGRIYFVIARGGWAGVQLFFVLSGFLITGILLDTKESPHFFRNFYIRRALRIFPAYYLVLILALWLGPLVFSTATEGVQLILRSQGWLWSYATNVAIFRHNGWMFDSGWLALDHAWSLAVEEQFYLAWPLLVFLLPRRGLGVVAWLAVLGAPFLRWAMLRGGISPEVVYSFTPCRLDALAMGSLLALFARSGASPLRQLGAAKALLIAGALTLAPVIAMTRGFDQEELAVQTIGYTALGILCSGIVFGAVVAPRGTRIERVLSSPPMTFIGRCSYGMYLYQGLFSPLFRELPVQRLAQWTGVVVACLCAFVFRFAVTTAIAFVSWQGFERRFLAYKDRFTR